VEIAGFQDPLCSFGQLRVRPMAAWKPALKELAGSPTDQNFLPIRRTVDRPRAAPRLSRSQTWPPWPAS